MQTARESARPRRKVPAQAAVPLEALADAAMLVNRRGVIVAANPCARHVAGWAAAVAPGAYCPVWGQHAAAIGRALRTRRVAVRRFNPSTVLLLLPLTGGRMLIILAGSGEPARLRSKLRTAVSRARCLLAANMELRCGYEVLAASLAKRQAAGDACADQVEGLLRANLDLLALNQQLEQELRVRPAPPRPHRGPRAERVFPNGAEAGP